MANVQRLSAVALAKNQDCHLAKKSRLSLTDRIHPVLPHQLASSL